MTYLGQLVDRTLLVGFEETDPPDWLHRVAPRLGAVVLYGQNLRSDGDVARLAGEFRSHHGGEVLLALDEEGGDVTRMHYHSGSPTPGNFALGVVDDLGATSAIAAGIGAELRAAGVLWDFAPDADVNANPANPVIGVRSFGADPLLVARHTAAWVTGLQSQGVAGCAKHFPGHGDTTQDSHLTLPVVSCTEREWRELHLPPFAAAIQAGVGSIMTGHLLVPTLDDTQATLSRRLLVELLRGEFGFEGVVVTDALEMAAIAETIGMGAGAVAALAAGADALIIGAGGGEASYRTVRGAILTAVRSGELPEARLEEAAHRVERLRAWTTASDAVATGSGDRSDTLAQSVARAAVVVSDVLPVPPLSGPPIIVELRATPNLAVGDAAWDLAGPLRDRGFPPSAVIQAREFDSELPEMLSRAAGNPIVVVGRDVVRQPWQRALWELMLARVGPSRTVLVDLGLPRPAELGPGPFVYAGGAARPNLAAAAEALLSGS
jgi:beta-N-acetylhexosaminidase